MKKIYLKTYGCQMNFHDTERIEAFLSYEGYILVNTPEEADFIAVNSCSVRKHAEDRGIAFLGSHKHLKNKGKLLCLFGCTANLYGKTLLKRYPFIDILCGAGNYAELPEILKNVKKQVSVTGENKNPFLNNFFKETSSISALTTVTKGCENFCSYCIVPFTRGRLISREPDDIYSEIESLIQRGVKELILLGQNVNEYGKDIGTSFTKLLERIHAIQGVVRLWFLTSHPKDIPEELLASFKNLPKLYRHLHLPIQSGSDRILKLMNRGYSVKRYMEIVDSIRKIVPDISLSSDIITGFPGEEPVDFNETLTLLKEIRFDDLFVFKYSERPYTAASKMGDNIPQKEKERRHAIILNMQNEISVEKNQGFLGKSEEVFVLRPSGKRKGFFLGRSAQNKSVLFEAPDSEPGKLETVIFTSANRRYLYGSSCGKNKEE